MVSQWTPADREMLAAAVRAAGGVRAVSAAAGFDHANVSRWLRRGVGLSAQRVERLLEVLGCPGGTAASDRILALRADQADEDLALALRWYVPDGAEVARMPHHQRGGSASPKPPWAERPLVYGVRAGSARLIVLLRAGALPRELFPRVFSGLRWWAGSPERAVLAVADPVRWRGADVDVCAFDAAWPGQGYHPTSADLLDAVRHAGLSYAEAIRRVRRG